MEENFNEINERADHEECSENCLPENANRDTKKEVKGAGLLKTSIALMFASSMMSVGVTGYQILSKDKNNDEYQKPQSTIGTVSNKTDSISVSEDGYWVINGVKTEFKAEAQDGSNGTDGEDGIYVKQARVVYNDKWHISSYIMFIMSDDSYITTNVQESVMNDHYYEASSAEDISLLVETYGVSKVRLANDIDLTRKLTIEDRLTIDLNEYKLTYSASKYMFINKDARVVFENGDLEFTTNNAIALSGENGSLKFNEVNIKAKANIVEVLGNNSNVKLVNSSIETLVDSGNGYSAVANNNASLFKVYGENLNLELKETDINTTINVVDVDDFAGSICISIKDSQIISTANLLSMDTSVVVPTITLDDDTMENSMLAGFNTSPVVSGEFNFNPEYAGIEGSAFNVDGKWVVVEDLATLIANVRDGATINLMDEIELDTAVVIDKNITLNLYGCYISLPEDTAGDGVFKIVEGGNLTINGEGVLNGVGNNDYSMAIWVCGGECTINGGTYTNVGAGEEDHYDLIYVKGGRLTINGGEFYGQTPAWLVNTSDPYRDSSTIVINGGVFHGFNPANNATENAGTNYVADGYIVVERDGVYTLETSLEMAMEDLSINEITLATDVVLDTAIVINREVVLNLNGFDISLPEDTAGDGVFKIVEGGNLTINGEGVINGVGNNDYSMAIWVNGGACTINGGTYTNVGAGEEDHYDLIYVKGGRLTINGGEFYGQTPAWLVNTSDSYRDSSTIVINGGVFHGFNPANNATENAGTNYVADGYKVVEAEGVYTVVESLGNVYVSSVEEFTVALANDDVKSITLASSLDFATAVVINRVIVLELNNKTLTVKNDTVGDGVFRIVEGGNLTINGEGVLNGVGKNNYNIVVWVNGGACTINGGTYTNVGATDSTDDDGHFDVIYVKGGSLTINGGEFIGETPAWLVNTHDGHRDVSTISITGGVFHGFNPADNLTETEGTNYVAEGYKAVENNGVYTVVAE